ncbi:hypothetical protein FNAPI_6687 [Fusarium napiforme]|uniref:F-box domain-containing protein n=1 Tax=Fusarium napiforme TaxID=42672 RepID=A0A8H5JGI1_9HYPO|nr:hypothetical protein FNAPI_6687 [Fusarium napiforme]
MLLLPHSSLYMIRQTCSAIRNLTDDFKFQAFQTDSLRSGEEHSCITKGGFGELRKIQQILLRRSLCTPCGRLFDSGELESRLKELWRPRSCIGCHYEHPTPLFPQGQKVVDRCAGLLGKLAVCKHLNATGKIESYVGGKTVIHCPDPEHVLVGRRDFGDLPDFQKYRAGISVDSTYKRPYAELFRTFPLAKINSQQYPDLEALKRHLMNQIRQLEPGSLCLHAANQLDSIVSCLVSDDCVLGKYSRYAFPDSKLPVYHGTHLPSLLDFIILILEGLLGIVTICESGYKIYKEYKSYMEDRKKRMKNKMMRDWDGREDNDMEMGWEANSSWTSPPYYQHSQGDHTRELSLTTEGQDAPVWKGLERLSDEQQAVLDNEQLEHERVWEFELDKMEREARRILPGGLPYGKSSYNMR